MILADVSLRQVTGAVKRNVVSFAYEFFGDTDTGPFSIGNVGMNGKQVIVDIASIRTQSVNLAPFKAIQINASFRAAVGPTVVPVLDGPLVVNVPDTGQTIVLPSTSYNQGSTGTTTGDIAIVSAIIPLITVAPTKIVIAKSVAEDGLLHGRVAINLFDFDAPTYTLQGITANGIG